MSRKMVRSDAVEFLQDQGVPATYPTLSGMARTNKGPAITRVGHVPLYDEDDLLGYVEEYKAKRAKTP